jgi:hypothetical protein
MTTPKPETMSAMIARWRDWDRHDSNITCADDLERLYERLWLLSDDLLVSGYFRKHLRDILGTPHTPKQCEHELFRRHPNPDQARHGEEFRCSCGTIWVHDCDEAEGCAWHVADSQRGTRPAARESGAAKGDE